MAFRLVSSGGGTVEPAVFNLAVSGVVNPGNPVDLIVGNGTGGAIITPSVGVNTTQSTIFGVALDYAQGASDTYVRVVPFTLQQVWEVDCANTTSTAQIGVRQYLSATRGFIHNQATDTSGINRVFLPFALSGAAAASGKLLGRFLTNAGLQS